MHALIGMVPPEPREPEAEDKKKERVAAGAPFTWITSHFGTCPEEANEDTVKTYARVYMWYVIFTGLCLQMSHGRMLHGCG